MVEKVFISPNRVRAYGNIINMKTGDDFTLVNSELTVTTDTVDGAEMTVFQFGVEGGISIALVSSASTCNVGDNVLLTATVLDDSAPVEAAEVTFKVGETVLGTDETDANGVATYTYAASTAGSFSFTASYQDSTSSVVSVSVNHSYSLSFSQSSYVATGGSATLECTLLEDNVALSGASITVTGTDSSTYTATTNSSGVASVTVTGINANTTFTATYSSVSDSVTIYYCKFADLTGDTSKYIYDSRCNVTSSNNEITVTWVSGTYLFWANKGDRSTEFDYTGDFTVEFDLLSNGGNTTIQIYDNSATIYYSKTLNQLSSMNAGHYKIVKDGQVFKTFVDGVEKTAQQVNSNITGACRVGFRTNSTSTIRFRNFVIY